MNIYAVIRTGGKQYRVSPGDVVRVEKLTGEPGGKIEFDQVCLLAFDGRIAAGNPVLKNTRVVTQVLDQDRGEKIIIFKHRRRKGYRKTIGHRQYFTELKIIEIIHEGTSYKEQPEKRQQSQQIAATATAPVAHKADGKRQKTAARKTPESRPGRETRQEEKITGKTPAPQQPEKPKPDERRIASANTPIPPAAVPERSQKKEPPVPAMPSREPEKPQLAAQVALAEQQSRDQEKKASSGKRGLWWIIAAIIAALAFSSLVLLVGSNRPSSRPEIRHEAGSKPVPQKQSRSKSPVRDVKTKETAPIDKPTAPAQPPD